MPSPIVHATLQAVTLSSISNIIAQVIEAHKNNVSVLSSLDILEFLRFVMLTLITAPPNYKWQHFLERRFPAHKPATATHSHKDNDIELAAEGQNEHDQVPKKQKLDIRNTITKWFIDCITLGAILNTIAFLILMGLMKGQTSAQITKNIRTETLPIIVNGYKIWPIASIVSFSFIPVERRIVFLSFIGLCWGVYMSFVAARV